jgi:N-acetylneuraminic acid mutarotase
MVIGIILSFLLVGSIGSSINIISFQKHVERKEESIQRLESDPLCSMIEPQLSKKPDNLAFKIQTSSNNTEDSDDFLEGTMENVTLDEIGSILLEKGSENYSWRNMTSTGPNGRHSHAMVYDSHSRKVILFGGDDGSMNGFADTWIYDLLTNTWTQMSPSTSPPARLWHSMVYDSHSRKVILFGGEGQSGDFADTWVYDLPMNTWTQMSPPTAPGYRMGHTMVYDSYSRKVILFGGFDSWYLNDTWTYDLPTNTWTQMSSLTAPSERAFHSMVYDSHSRKVILFGGDDGLTGYQADTWIYDLLTNTWTQMSPPTAPSGRAFHSMVYDTMYDKVILFGGYNNRADTWIYDTPSNNWTLLNNIASSPGRWDFTMVYNLDFSQAILFGGYDELADTWILYPEYSPTGMFESKLTSLGDIYNLRGRITWNPSVQPANTSLSIQVGLSNTTNEEDFLYTAYSNSTFIFEGLAQYIRYRVLFESDETQYYSPILDLVSISYSLEKPEPMIQITNPQDNSAVVGLITISVLADSPNGIEKVSFYVEGHLIAFDYSIPYNCSWNSLNTENGSVSVIVVAVSVLGKENIDSIQIFVNNPTDSVPKVSVPSPPQSLSTIAGDNFIFLSWNVPTDDGGSTITHYRVYRGTITGEYMFMGITSTVSFNDTFVQADTTYFYVVTAMNVIGESTFSTEVSVTTTTITTTTAEAGTFPSYLQIIVSCVILVVVVRRLKKT